MKKLAITAKKSAFSLHDALIFTPSAHIIGVYRADNPGRVAYTHLIMCARSAPLNHRILCLALPVEPRVILMFAHGYAHPGGCKTLIQVKAIVPGALFFQLMVIQRGISGQVNIIGARDDY